MDLENWKKRVEEMVNTENIPQVLKRCPKCNALSLEFDTKTGKIKCIKCGFNENIPTFGDEK